MCPILSNTKLSACYNIIGCYVQRNAITLLSHLPQTEKFSSKTSNYRSNFRIVVSDWTTHIIGQVLRIASDERTCILSVFFLSFQPV